MNQLFYGDNLVMLPEHVANESVDLVYLDPPFNSKASYNLLFTEKTGGKSQAQLLAFKDTWEWNDDSERLFDRLRNEVGGKVGDVVNALQLFLGRSAMMAYIVRMAATLSELKRVMKPTATIYLHCDPTASHYLKIVLDAIFGPKRFLNEITWKRSSAHSDVKQGMKRCGKIRDVLLVYTKSDEYTFNPQYTPYTKEYLEEEYRHKDKDGRYYKETDATAAKPGGDTEYDWPVKRPVGGTHRWEPDLTEEFRTPKDGWEYKPDVRPYEGRFWAYSKDNLVQFWKDGKLIHRKTGMPRIIHFADEMPGIPLQDLWDDIPPALGNEDLGYPTQKPFALLRRIVELSTNPGDVVLDPFCGCGTTVDAAQYLDRRWVGIDIAHAAINHIKHRLRRQYGPDIDKTYTIVGTPVSIPDAEELAKLDRYQFQWWALSLVGSRPIDKKKGADKGIDGRLFFSDGEDQHLVISVKSGHLKLQDVRDLRGVMEREEAKIGVLISLQKPTREMKKEAAAAGFYSTSWGKHPRLQILTIEELLDGAKIDYPPVAQTVATMPKYAKKARARGETIGLPF